MASYASPLFHRLTTSTLRGRFLFLLGPTGLSCLFGDLTPAAVREGFEPTLATNPPTLAAHFRHDLRNDRAAGWCGSGWLNPDRLQDDPARILHGVELWLANTFRNTSTVARRGP